MDAVTPESEAEAAEQVDRSFHAALAKVTGGLSPTSVVMAWYDWAMHLVGSPAKQAELATMAVKGMADMGRETVDCALSQGERPSLQADSRFAAPDWQRFPFNLWAESFLKTESWWNAATSGMKGVDPHHANLVNFGARQVLDMASPSNFLMTNPVVMNRTAAERGANLARGFQQWLSDLSDLSEQDAATEGRFVVGEDVAATPGEVVYRNRLIELIRYRPTGDMVRAEPLLMVPAWIMKYYILDLSAGNSMVKFLLAQGYEVYMISWKNPGAEDADLSMQDYVDLGVRAALDEITRLVPGQKVHAAGYCLGGTLLTITAAAMARDGDDRLASVTLMAAQTDFSEPGEIALFIDESQVAFLEDIMAQQGYLEADRMSGAFQMLRSNDLIWGRLVRAYLMGERGRMNDLMAWNADTTRMPATMHSQYLRELFLKNALALGFYHVDGRHVSLDDLTVPMFVVGTEADHVAPWRSVWKITRLTDAPLTFALTNGGHNAGILSEPGHRHRHHRVAEVTDRLQSAEAWMEATEADEGSWWPAWADWLSGQSARTMRSATLPDAELPEAGLKEAGLGPAPGTYVLMK